MKNKLRFDITTPPSVNAMFCNNKKNGRGRFKSKKYVEWIGINTNNIVQTFICYKNIINKKYLPLEFRKIRLDIFIARPTKSSDIDNRIKAIPDLLQSCKVISNDSIIEEIRIKWLDKKEQSYVLLYHDLILKE